MLFLGMRRRTELTHKLSRKRWGWYPKIVAKALQYSIMSVVGETPSSDAQKILRRLGVESQDLAFHCQWGTSKTDCGSTKKPRESRLENLESHLENRLKNGGLNNKHLVLNGAEKRYVGHSSVLGNPVWRGTYWWNFDKVECH